MGASTQRRALRAVLVASIAAAMMLMTAASAFAQYPPPPAPTSDITFEVSGAENGDPDTLPPGGTGTFRAGGFPPFTDVHVTVEINPVLFDGIVRSNANGEIFVRYSIPADAPAGSIVASLSGDGVDGEVVTTIGIVQPTATTAGLASTGANTSTLLLVGIAVAGIGIIALLVGRRREHARADLGADVHA